MIRNGYPKNITAIVNSNVSFSCPTYYIDYRVQIQWQNKFKEDLNVSIFYFNSNIFIKIFSLDIKWR